MSNLSFRFQPFSGCHSGKARIHCKSLKWHWNGIVYSARASSSYCCPYIIFVYWQYWLCCYGRKKTTAEKTEINKQVYTENCARCEIFGCPNEFFGLWEQVDGCRWHHNFLCHAPHLQMHNLSRDGQSESGLEGERERKIADYVVKMSQDIKVKCWVRENTEKNTMCVCACVYADACNNCLPFKGCSAERGRGRGCNGECGPK